VFLSFIVSITAETIKQK